MKPQQLWARKRGRAAGTGRRGAAVVEFALVAPLLFLFIFLLIELGRYIMLRQIVVNGSRVGARYAVMSGSDLAGVRTEVNNYLQGCLISAAAYDVNNDIVIEHQNSGDTNFRTTTDLQAGSPAGPEAGDPVRVTISLNYGQCSWLSPTLLDDLLRLAAGGTWDFDGTIGPSLSAAALARKEGG